MSNSVYAFIDSQEADNYILYSLLFFLHFEKPEIDHFDVDAPISKYDENFLLLAVGLFETIHGIDVPDDYIQDNKKKTLRELADKIRLLPKLTDEKFQKKFMIGKALLKAINERN